MRSIPKLLAALMAWSWRAIRSVWRRTPAAVCMGLSLLVLGNTGAVAALTPQQRFSLNSQGISFIDSPCVVGGTVGGGTTVTATQSQTDNIKVILGVAKGLNLPKQAGLIALMAGLAESGIQVHSNKTNVPLSLNYPGNIQGDGSDHNSVGIFQMQPDQGWSTFVDGGNAALNNQDAVNQDMNPATAAEIFFGVPKDADLSGLVHPGALLKGVQSVDNWQNKDPGAVAQDVEGSAFPDAYGKKLDQATSFLNQYWDQSDIILPPISFKTGGGDTGGSSSTAITNCALGASPITNCTVDNSTLTGPGAEILCDAERYAGIYYRWGGGHSGSNGPYDKFIKGCPDPRHPPNNIPYDSSIAHGGNPSPCGLDCSGIVSIAVDDVTGHKFDWVVADITADRTNWQKISIAQAAPGDVVTHGTEHVEFFVSYDKSNNIVHTFGSHQTGRATSTSSGTFGSSYDSVYRYIGGGLTPPGASAN